MHHPARAPGPSLALILALGLALTGCSLPQGSPLVSQVTAGVDAPDANFAIRYVTRDNLDALKSWPLTGPYAISGWIKGGGGVAGQVIEAGDLVNVTLWDNEESSLLSSPGQKVVQLPNLTVSPAGTIFLPYADEVYVAKMSAEDARKAVQAKLLPMIPSVQVQLNYVSGRKSSVDLVSGMAQPGNYPLEDRNMTLLSVLALGGGVPAGTVNPQVRVSRGGKLYGISMERLLANPALDPALRGGDKIFVEAEQRYFLSFGAAGREAQIKFPQDTLTAMEAVTISGGLNENRADAKGILILRDYAANAVRSDGTGPEKERMIFAFDLTTADGLFSAGEFPIQHKDLVLATESPVNNTRTILSLFGTSLGLANAAQRF